MRIGVDMGGTKIEAIALGPDGRECARKRIDAPKSDYDATIQAVLGLVHELRVGLKRPGTVGVGHPGCIEAETGLLKNSNSTWLNGKPLAADLAAALREPVRTANDANCFALSEATDGSARDASSVFGVILGTGVGGGLVVGGHILEGANGIAGEWGHNPLTVGLDETAAPSCYCGNRGCVETYLSGPALSREHARRTGVVLPAKQIDELARHGDEPARQSLADYTERLARGLASVINVFDPHVIVLGGGLSNIQSLYARVPSIWGRWIFSDIVKTRLVPPRHGDSSGVRGAAWLWPAE